MMMLNRRLALIAMSFFVSVFIIAGCGSESKKEDTKEHAYQMARFYARQALALPDQAKFDLEKENGYLVTIEGTTEKGYNKYRVVGNNLKAKNAYGVYIPYVYIYHIHYTGKEGEDGLPLWRKTKGQAIPVALLSPDAKQLIMGILEEQ